MQRKVFTKWQTFWERIYLWEESHKWKARTLKCRCSCGEIRWVLVDSILRWVSKSCWCKKIKHNLTKTKFNTAYVNMVQRCENPNHKSYKDYWAKWIRVEREDFMEFYNDMYDSYLEHCKKFWERETTIDRIDSKWNYCKENCRWATHLEQSNNLSSNRKVIYKWKEYKTLSSLCREIGIGVTTMNQRINKYGRSIEKAIETPVDFRYSHKRSNVKKEQGN